MDSKYIDGTTYCHKSYIIKKNHLPKKKYIKFYQFTAKSIMKVIIIIMKLAFFSMENAGQCPGFGIMKVIFLIWK